MISNTSPLVQNPLLNDLVPDIKIGTSTSLVLAAGAVSGNLVASSGATGVIQEIVVNLSAALVGVGIVLNIDGTAYPLHTPVGGVAKRLWEVGFGYPGMQASASTIAYTTARLCGPLPFKNSWTLKLKNEAATGTPTFNIQYAVVTGVVVR